jgi:hypothetical protein
VSLKQLADFAIARSPTGKSSFELEKEVNEGKQPWHQRRLRPAFLAIGSVA